MKRTARHHDVKVSRGFTLIELLVVVAIIALLISILLPSLARARQQAFQVKCASHLNAVFKGFFYYADDKYNGGGYLPNIATYYSEKGHWAAQIVPYVDIKRSRIGSRDGLLRCPAHADPGYVWITGPSAGEAATEADKLKQDAGIGATRGDPLAAGGGTAGSGPRLGSLIEPVSYTGSCNLARFTTAPGADGRPLGMYSPRIEEIEKPHCYPLLGEAAYTGTFCFRLDGLARFHADDPHMRRHYGGDNPANNGSNWMFADGHVQWHSFNYATTTLICCVDVRVTPDTDQGNNAPSALIADQRKLCGSNR